MIFEYTTHHVSAASLATSGVRTPEVSSSMIHDSIEVPYEMHTDSINANLPQYSHKKTIVPVKRSSFKLIGSGIALVSGLLITALYFGSKVALKLKHLNNLKELTKVSNELNEELFQWEQYFDSRIRREPYMEKRHLNMNVNLHEYLNLFTLNKPNAVVADVGEKDRKAWFAYIKPFFTAANIAGYTRSTYIFEFAVYNMKIFGYTSDKGITDYKISTNQPIQFDKLALKKYIDNYDTKKPHGETDVKRLTVFLNRAERLISLRRKYMRLKDVAYQSLLSINPDVATYKIDELLNQELKK